MAKKRKKDGKRVRNPVDWPEARRIYIEGGIDPVTGTITKYTYAYVAKQLGASRSAICRKANSEGWERQRIKRREEKEADISELLKDFEIPMLAEVRKQLIQTAYEAILEFAKQLKAGTVEIKVTDFNAIAKFLVSQLESVYGIEGADEGTAIIVEGIAWKEIILSAATHLKDLEE